LKAISILKSLLLSSPFKNISYLINYLGGLHR
jgi:hypothetical protein